MYFVSLLRQGVRTPSINYGALAVVCRWVCNLSVTSDSSADFCRGV